jgi:NADPH:quinone reductase-like Zn-dependent oxidoreductase
VQRGVLAAPIRNSSFTLNQEPFTPGIEMAGVVEAVGPGASADLLGQIAKGAYAEYVSVPVEVLALKPESLSFIEATAFLVGATLAWRALFETAGLASGQRELIQAATSQSS